MLYGAGLRLMECVRLRVKDVDLEYRCITVRDGKGGKDRVTVLPDTLLEALRAQLDRVRGLHRADLAHGYGEVYLPYALAVKYPSAAGSLGWQYLFPSAKLARDPRSGAIRRHHVQAQMLQRAVKRAVAGAAIHTAPSG